MNTSRRDFLATTALASAAGCAAPRAIAPLTIIDTHTHFYDPARPGGVPWPGKGDALLHRTTLPADYRAQPVPQPVTATVVVEASPLVEDNQWILDLAAKDKFIVGFVGNLKPGEEAFAGHLKRFAANPPYRGIRVNALAPGPVETEMARQVHSPEIRADYRDAIPLARYGSLEEIAQCVGFLCSDEASYVNGQILAADGGFDAAGIGLPTLRRSRQA